MQPIYGKHNSAALKPIYGAHYTDAVQAPVNYHRINKDVQLQVAIQRLRTNDKQAVPYAALLHVQSDMNRSIRAAKHLRTQNYRYAKTAGSLPKDMRLHREKGFY